MKTQQGKPELFFIHRLVCPLRREMKTRYANLGNEIGDKGYPREWGAGRLAGWLARVADDASH